MSDNKPNVGSNEAQYIIERNKNAFYSQSKDIIKICYSEVNVALADAERGRSLETGVGPASRPLDLRAWGPPRLKISDPKSTSPFRKLHVQ